MLIWGNSNSRAQAQQLRIYFDRWARPFTSRMWSSKFSTPIAKGRFVSDNCRVKSAYFHLMRNVSPVACDRCITINVPPVFRSLTDRVNGSH